MARTVLIVDDNAMVRHTLRELFKHETDFDICGEAEDGIQAVKLCEQVQPDLVVIDYSMPVMNGIEAAGVIHNKLPNTVLILFTLHGSRLVEEEAATAGISAVVSKTKEASALIQTARELLEKSSVKVEYLSSLGKTKTRPPRPRTAR
jgi:DNA-binding NarL/FixJ family response regulator